MTAGNEFMSTQEEEEEVSASLLGSVASEEIDDELLPETITKEPSGEVEEPIVPSELAASLFEGPGAEFEHDEWTQASRADELIDEDALAQLSQESELFASEPESELAAADLKPLENEGGVSRQHLKGLLESLVFVSDKPIKAGDLAKAASAPIKEVQELLVELKAEFAHRGVLLDEVAGGWVFRTNAAFSPFVRDLTKQKPVKMSRAQLETLAILAYRQPITRPEIDEIRGVDSGATLKMLLERELVRILGKKDEPGRPLLYGTTPQFLEFFGLKSLKDMPTLKEFTELNEDSLRVVERELGELGEPQDADAAAMVTNSVTSAFAAADALSAAHQTTETDRVPPPDAEDDDRTETQHFGPENNGNLIDEHEVGPSSTSPEGEDEDDDFDDEDDDSEDDLDDDDDEDVPASP